MVLPENMEIAYNKNVARLEEGKSMPYITTAERIGRREGRKEGKIQTARKMIREGLDVALIAKVTGLPKKTVEQLRKEENE
jgi:predicted transposase/invertase (TIGR01784 family)